VTDEYFAMIKADLTASPIHWLIHRAATNGPTHRPNNGSYNPHERLAKVRRVFFPRPTRTLGQNSVRVWSQADRGFVENVSYSRANVGFAAVHVVGSNNSLLLWTGNPAPAPEQLHVFNQDQPLGIGSSWLSFYGVPAAPNLTRITVDGCTGVVNYLRVSVSPSDSQVLTVVRSPLHLTYCSADPLASRVLVRACQCATAVAA
jgi:hypothetical protein